MDRWVFLTFDGLSRGAVYAVLALALVIIWRGARVVNFAQGAMAAASAYAAYGVATATGSYWAGFAAAVAAGLVLGAGVDRAVMRRLGHASPLVPVIAALGVVMVVQAALGMVYGNEYLPFPLPFTRTALTVGGTAVLSPYDLFVLATVAVLVVGLVVLFTRTAVGLRMRAAASAPDTARLLGVDVARMRTLGWALAAAVGGVAAMLAVPTGLGLNPHAMDLVFVSAFTAAVVGGLDSAPGAVVGGLVVGLVLSYASGYLGADVTPVAVLALLAGVLLVRPRGLFAATRARTV